MWSTLRWNSPASEEAERRPTHLAKTQRTEEEGSQWKRCAHGFHLNTCKTHLLIAVCKHLMTACPTTGQGSHHQAIKHSGSAIPSQTANNPYTTTFISGTQKQEEARIKPKPHRRLICCPCKKRTPCSAHPALYWKAGPGGHRASPMSILVLGRAQQAQPHCSAVVPIALTEALHPWHKETYSNWLGLTSPATALPR